MLPLLFLSTLQGAVNTDDVRAEIADALRDARSRSSLLLTAPPSGHDGGFFIADDPGDFRLDFSGQIQTRYLASWRDDSGGVDPFTPGFQMRRVKFNLAGHVFDESLRFKVTNEYSRSSGSGSVSDAFIEKRFDHGVSLTIGQFTLPFTREDLDSSKRLLAVDRSLVNGEFRLERSQGVVLAFGGDDRKAWLAFSDGLQSKNTDFGADPTDWAVTARGEWLVTGTFGAFRSEAGASDAESSVRLGGAIHAEERGASAGDAGGRLVTWTGDATAAGAGWIAFASYVGRRNDEPAGATFTDSGVTAQLGVWATEDVLPFVRWELLIPDGDRAGDSKTNALTAGANWYLHGEALKLTIDGVWLVDGAGHNDLIGASTGEGILAPGAGDDEFVLRLQAQLLF